MVGCPRTPNLPTNSTSRITPQLGIARNQRGAPGRFELTVAPNDDVGGVRAGQIVKAAIVVKEGVRPLRASGGILPRIRISDDRAL